MKLLGEGHASETLVGVFVGERRGRERWLKGAGCVLGHGMSLVRGGYLRLSVASNTCEDKGEEKAATEGHHLVWTESALGIRI